MFALFFLTGSNSNKRNRRDTGSVNLEYVRSEIQSQLRSLTASQLCSRQDKICLEGPPGPRGEPGARGRRGKKGESNMTILSSLCSFPDTLITFILILISQFFFSITCLVQKIDVLTTIVQGWKTIWYTSCQLGFLTQGRI